MLNRQNNFIDFSDGHMTINNYYWKDLIPNIDICDTLVFNTRHIRHNVNKFVEVANSVFQKNICAFALKVAPHENILEAINSANREFGVEVYNLSELNMALNLKCSPIIVDGYYKSYEFIETSVKNHVFLINADSFDEIKQINEIGEKNNTIVDIGVRVKEDDISKMGISLIEIKSRIKELKSFRWVNLKGVHMHPGSNRQDFKKNSPLFTNLLRALDFFVESGLCIEYIDIGGGYGEISRVGNSLEEYLLNIKALFSKYSDLTFILEPGRAITADTGILFTKIVSINNFDKLVNVGITLSPFLFTTSATLLVEFPDSSLPEKYLNYSVAGIWPISSDIITVDKLNNKIPEDIEVGDFIAIFNAGAYVLDRLPEYSFDEVQVVFI